MKKILIGHIAVDSGTLIIVDPSYLDGEWVKAREVEGYAVDCLGKDVDAIVAALRTFPATGEVQPMAGGRWYRVHTKAGHTAPELLEEAERLKSVNGWIGATIPVSHDSMEKIADAVRDRLGAVLHFSHGNDGLMAAVSLGGDGRYPVYAVTGDRNGETELKAIEIDIANS